MDTGDDIRFPALQLRALVGTGIVGDHSEGKGDPRMLCPDCGGELQDHDFDPQSLVVCSC